MSHCRLFCLGLPLVIAVAVQPSGQLRAADEPAPVRRAKAVIEAEASWVLAFAHPTATFKSATYEGFQKKGARYVVSYMMTYDNAAGTTLNPTFAFTFDSDGLYEDCRRSIARNAIFPPFVAADFLLDVFKDAIRDDPDLKENKELKALIEETDAKEMLRIYLQFKQGSADEVVAKFAKALNRARSRR